MPILTPNRNRKEALKESPKTLALSKKRRAEAFQITVIFRFPFA